MRFVVNRDGLSYLDDDSWDIASFHVYYSFMRSLEFTKMHGIGNDFILVDAIRQPLPQNINELAIKLCNRNFGVGADGLILALPSETEDIRMRIINPDGSEPEMCGNGIRCFALFVRENELVSADSFSVETEAGRMQPSIVDTEESLLVRVDMGPPILHPKDIPLLGQTSERAIDVPISVNGETFAFTGVSMGNPHAVVFVDALSAVDLEVVGPLFEHHSFFPERVNTEFVEVVSDQEAHMKVWERGAGATLACGTGACAIVVAGVLSGRLARQAVIHLPGGDLEIEWDKASNHVFMTGPADKTFEAKINI